MLYGVYSKIFILKGFYVIWNVFKLVFLLCEFRKQWIRVSSSGSLWSALVCLSFSCLEHQWVKLDPSTFHRHNVIPRLFSPCLLKSEKSVTHSPPFGSFPKQWKTIWTKKVKFLGFSLQCLKIAKKSHFTTTKWIPELSGSSDMGKD